MKGAIFDFDGTLFDSMWVWKDIDLTFLSRYGHVPPPQLRASIKTMSVWESAQLFRDTYSLPLDVPGIVAAFGDIALERYRRDIKPKPFVKEYLIQLKTQGLPLCIATATSGQNIKAALSREKMQGHFDFLLTPDQIHSGKDSPEIYLACAEKMGLPPKDIVVFEDALHCVQTAKRAGFSVIAVADESAKDAREQIMAAADRYITSFKELLV